jgi:hypothetical protein
VTSPDRVRGELTASGAGSSLSPVSGFIDHTFVLYADLGEYGIEALELGLDAQGGPPHREVSRTGRGILPCVASFC